MKRVIRLRDLVFSDPQRTIGELAIPALAVLPTTSLDELEELFDENDFAAEPVVDSRGTLLGIVRRRAVLEALDELALSRLRPKAIVMDNGLELTGKAKFFWSQRTGVKLSFIQPGKPAQNAFVESFNARFRDGWLNQHSFCSLDDAREIIATWRKRYNNVRPHSSPGYEAPAVFETKAA